MTPEPGRPATYSITVVTSSGDATVSVNANQTLQSAIQQAFAELSITTAAKDLTYRTEEGTSVQLQQQIHDICKEFTCTIYADPKKVTDG